MHIFLKTDFPFFCLLLFAVCTVCTCCHPPNSGTELYRPQDERYLRCFDLKMRDSFTVLTVTCSEGLSQWSGENERNIF